MVPFLVDNPFDGMLDFSRLETLRPITFLAGGLVSVLICFSHTMSRKGRG